MRWTRRVAKGSRIALKPANILVTKQGIKLLDFGLAKRGAPLQESDVIMALTREFEIVGSLQYTSPEQLQGKEVDARSDLFPFGCVLHEMLTGKRAFDGKSAASLIAAILERDPAPLTTAAPLKEIVRRCLAKDPDQRFRTARDLKAALTWTLETNVAVNHNRAEDLVVFEIESKRSLLLLDWAAESIHRALSGTEGATSASAAGCVNSESRR
jgi:serine/threonine protein kinase